MVEDCKVSVGPVTRGTATFEDAGDAASVAAMTTDEVTLEMAAQRHKARSQMLWMVGKARDATKNERVADARWWRERAICALWNLN